MTFQFFNLFLLGLLLSFIPILIHLINQRRHRTVEWGAMMFLLSAKKMSRGMALIRQILIMAARMTIIIGLMTAISQPLISGWLSSLAGGKPKTVIVILDRSSSMKQQQLSSGESKLDAGLIKIANMISTYDPNMNIVLIESTTNRPVQVISPAALLDYPKTFPTDSSANIPEMLQTAMDYVRDNQAGRTDIWVCSDAKQNDWDPDSSRWSSLRSGFSEQWGVRFHLLNYPDDVEENYSVVVNRAEQISTSNGSFLEMDLVVRRNTESQAKETIQANLIINGSPTALPIEMENEEYTLTGFRVQLTDGSNSGWGLVELPNDSNESDNRFYFSFAKQPVFESVVVSDNSKASRALQLAAEKGPDSTRQYLSTVVKSDQLGEIDWKRTALLLWQAPLPADETIRQRINDFVDTGRTVIFFPPDEVDSTEFAGVSWGGWERLTVEADGQAVKNWQDQADLLRNTRNGDPLGLDKVSVYKYCSLNGKGRTLAVLDNDSELLRRQSTNNGGIYFFSTLPDGSHSSFERQGIILFAMIQRALASGGSSIGKAKQLVAGTSHANVVAELPALSANPVELSESRPFNAGVYGNDEQIIALNRPIIEDMAPAIPKIEIEGLFDGLDAHIIEDELGNSSALLSEWWRTFAIIMGLAVLAEAIFCLPPNPEPESVELGGIRV